MPVASPRPPGHEGTPPPMRSRPLPISGLDQLSLPSRCPLSMVTSIAAIENALCKHQGCVLCPFFRERGYHYLSLDQHPHPELLNASIIGHWLSSFRPQFAASLKTRKVSFWKILNVMVDRILYNIYRFLVPIQLVAKVIQTRNLYRYPTTDRFKQADPTFKRGKFFPSQTDRRIWGLLFVAVAGHVPAYCFAHVSW